MLNRFIISCHGRWTPELFHQIPRTYSQTRRSCGAYPSTRCPPSLRRPQTSRTSPTSVTPDPYIRLDRRVLDDTTRLPADGPPQLRLFISFAPDSMTTSRFRGWVVM